MLLEVGDEHEPLPCLQIYQRLVESSVLQEKMGGPMRIKVRSLPLSLDSLPCRASMHPHS